MNHNIFRNWFTGLFTQILVDFDLALSGVNSAVDGGYVMIDFALLAKLHPYITLLNYLLIN